MVNMRSLGALLALVLVACSGPPGGSNDAGLDATPDTSAAPDSGGCAKGAPSGFSIIAPAATTGRVGVHAAMTLDGADDPVVAWVWSDPNGDTDRFDSTLQFARWDRCAGAIGAPATIDTVGAVDENQPSRNVAIARDAQTSAVGVLYQKATRAAQTVITDVVLATSQGGPWTKTTLSRHIQQDQGIEASRAPALAMRGGKVFAAYHQDWQLCGSGKCDSGWYWDGAQQQALPVPPSYADHDRASTVAIALDASGQPAVTYVVEPASGNTKALVYWRPGGAPVVVTDTAGTQNDQISTSIAFDGMKPRIAAHLVRDTSNTHDMIFAASDDGVTWSVSALPRDGGDVTQWYQSLAVDAKGAIAVAAYWQGGNTQGACGGPKILRAPNGASAFTVCGANARRDVGTLGLWVTAAYGQDGKLALAFLDVDDKHPAQPPGVLFWRE